MSAQWNDIAKSLKIEWRASQNDAFKLWTEGLPSKTNKMLLFFPTGEGKTLTSLALMKIRGFDTVVIIAPPITHAEWKAKASLLDLKPILMSATKFRMKGTKLPKDTPVIVDEVHELGGHGKMGSDKMIRVAPHLPAVILASATPNYNDGERVYIIAKICDPLNNMGGYIPWLYRHCITRVNPFASTPHVDGLLGYERASDWLLDAGYTAFAEDTATWIDKEDHYATDWDDELFTLYGLDTSQMRIMASQMEERHRIRYLNRVNPETGQLWPSVLEQLLSHLNDEPYLIFCAHETVAKAVAASLDEYADVTLITGKTSTVEKSNLVHRVMNSPADKVVLVGTSAMATGLDGLDKICNKLIIFDDLIGDGAKRRQLIGRVLPRSVEYRETYVTTAIFQE